MYKVMIPDEVFNKRGGKNLAIKVDRARRRHLGYSLLMPLKPGEVGHHITNKFVIGVPKEAHEKCNGNRTAHRRKVLKWLKRHDKSKYCLVIFVFKNHSSP